MSGLLSDLKHAARGLARRRALAVSAVSCLALGIGLTVAMLDALDVLLLRPPAHVVDADSVVRLYVTQTHPVSGEPRPIITSYPVLADLRAGAAEVVNLAAVFPLDVSLGSGAGARPARAALVTDSYFGALGVQPERGRLFTAGEADAAAPSPVVLVSSELRRSGLADLGDELRIGRDLYTVVGVLPPGFTGIDLETIDLWLPVNAAAQLLFGEGWHESGGTFFLEVLGRLRPGVPVPAAEQRLTAVWRAATSAAGVLQREPRVALGPAQLARGPGNDPDLDVTVWLAGMAGAVLLIAAANVASLLLVRGLERRRELAVRAALGAGPGRLARSVVAEAALLTALGGVAALAVALASRRLVRALLVPELAEGFGAPGLRTLAILALSTVAAGLLCAALPVLSAGRLSLVEVIKDGAREGSPGRSQLRTALLGGQVALTCALLAGAGLFVRSLLNLRSLDLGLDVERLLFASLDLEGEAPSTVDALYRQALERVRRLPGVESASLTTGVPLLSSSVIPLEVPGRPELPQLPTGGPYVNAVSEGFFATTGTELTRGRGFAAAEDTRVAVVNETFARLVWPGREPLGECLEIGGDEAPCAEVVGVVEDARRTGLLEEPTMQYYIPLDQAPEHLTSRALLVRAADDPRALSEIAERVRRELQALAPELPFVRVRRLADRLEPQLRPWRLGAAMLSLFGLVALAVAVVGIAGSVAHAIARRSHELAVRLALGAERREAARLIARQGLGATLAGTALGLIGVLAAGSSVESLLFEVSASDPGTLAVAALALLGAALAAILAQTRRLLRIDPAAALRSE